MGDERQETRDERLGMRYRRAWGEERRDGRREMREVRLGDERHETKGGRWETRDERHGDKSNKGGPSSS